MLIPPVGARMAYTCLLGYYVVLRLLDTLGLLFDTETLILSRVNVQLCKICEILIGCKLGQDFQNEYSGEALEICLGQQTPQIKTTLHSLWLSGETLTG